VKDCQSDELGGGTAPFSATSTPVLRLDERWVEAAQSPRARRQACSRSEIRGSGRLGRQR
jgi:hypothetical protein